MYKKKEMIARTADIANITKQDAEYVIMAYHAAMVEAIEMAGGCKISGYFTLKAKKQDPFRVTLNGNTMDVPEKYKLRFIPGVLLQDAVELWSE